MSDHEFENLKSLAHLFHTNDPLNPSETATVQRKLDHQDAAIYNFEQRLHALQVDRERYASLLSPFRSRPLPIELWGDIFAIVIAPLHDQLDDTDLESPTGARATGLYVRQNVSRARSKLIQLCLVCRAWRDAVYATPYLWSRLDIYWPSLDFDKVVRWFGLARGHPRKRLCISPAYKYGFKEWQFDVLKRLMEEGPLIEYLELDMITETRGLGEGGRWYAAMVRRLKYPKRREMKGKRPWDLVKSFSIHLDWANADIKEVIIPFQHLTTLHLALPAFYDRTSWSNEAEGADSKNAPFDIPIATLQNLTTLSITLCDWKPSVLLALFRWCTNLEHLTIVYATIALDDDNDDDEDSDDLSFVLSSSTGGLLLPALKVLCLRNLEPRRRAYPTDYQSVLGVLRMPNLEELDMGFAKVPEWHPKDVGDDPEDLEYRWEDCELLERRMAAFGQRVVKEAKAKVGAQATGEHNRSEPEDEHAGSGSGEPALKRLRLHNLDISSKSLTSILQALPPSISHLTLDSVYSDSTLFKRLEQASENSALLPKLQVLELLNIKRGCTHLPDIYAFVASRRLFGEFNVPEMEETVALKELKMSIVETKSNSDSDKSKGKGEGEVEVEVGARRPDDILRLVYGVDVDVRLVREGED